MQTGGEKKAILDEYAKLTGFHRKYATAKLNSCIKKREHIYNNCVIKTTKVELPKKKRRSYEPKYGADVISSLVKIWRTFDCMCGREEQDCISNCAASFLSLLCKVKKL